MPERPTSDGFIGLHDVNRTFDEVFARPSRDELVGMREAVEETCVEIAGGPTAIPEDERNAIADILSRQATIYSISDDGGSARPLDAHEVRSGRFMEGGQVLAFRDRRNAVRGLAIKRQELRAAIASMKRK